MMHLLLPAALLMAASGPTGAAPDARRAALSLRAATPNRTSVGRCQKLELTLDLSATYDNPFDPEQIDVYAVFTPPRGAPIRVNGFLNQPFTRALRDGEERITPAGEPVWTVRFAPDQLGAWRYRVHARDRSGTTELPEARFRVVPSGTPGFVRRSRRSPALFAYDNGRPYIAVGENMCWGGKRGSFDYDDWLPALSKAGGNWVRIWMSTWNCALEWTADNKGDWRSGGYHGLGVYSLDNAWKLDQILDTAERNGIDVMLCLGTFGELTTGGYFNEGQWKANPYNAANGGPCAAPADFCTNPQARMLYRRRLRYIAARYGYRTNLHSWEFWNEYSAPAAWVGEMARYLKGTGEFAGQGADPYRHLVSTTYGNPEVWRIPEIDFTQSHSYGTGNIPDHGPVVHADALQHAGFGKPHLMAEFGIDYRGPDNPYDPEGRAVNLHNALWSSLLSGNAGTAMIWWWDSYIHPKNLYGQFTALRRFADAVPWGAGAWRAVQTDAPRITAGQEVWTDLVVPAAFGWGRSPTVEFTVTPGGLASGALLPQFLYGPAKPDLRTRPAFHLELAAPGRFIVHLDEVSQTSRLRILLDGRLAREIVLSAAPPADPNTRPEYEKTARREEYGTWQATFNKEYGVDVPAGAHTITLENVEGDWASISSITVTGYRSSRYPQLDVYGLASGPMAVLWIHNPLQTWKNVLDRKPVPVLQGVETAVRGLPTGRYRVEWWDTVTGVVTRRDEAVCRNSALPIRLPELATDVAAVSRKR